MWLSQWTPVTNYVWKTTKCYKNEHWTQACFCHMLSLPINKFLFFLNHAFTTHILYLSKKKPSYFKSGELCESVLKQKHENVKGTIRGK